jgi:predicted kinase
MHPTAPGTHPHGIIAVTGVQAAGKSTVARLLAQRLPPAADVEADALHRMIVSGAEWVRDPGTPNPESARQLRLRLKNMCLLGISFYQAGFTAVLDDIILGDRWHHFQEDLRGYPFSLVVLAPSIDTVRLRDEQRPKPTLGAAWATYLDDALRSTLPGHGLWIDTTDRTPEATVDHILGHLYPGSRSTDSRTFSIQPIDN